MHLSSGTTTIVALFFKKKRISGTIYFASNSHQLKVPKCRDSHSSLNLSH